MQIKLNVSRIVNGDFFKLSVLLIEGKILMNLIFLNSIKDSKQYYEKLENICDLISKSENKSKELVEEITQKFNSLSEEHHILKKHELILDINKYDTFNSFINSLGTYKYEQSLENEHVRNLLILDGVSMALNISKDSDIIFHIDNPTIETHPILISFLSTSLEIFRENKIIPLNKEITFGF